MNNFLVDKEYAMQYEVYFALLFNMKWNNTNKDDKGVDIYNDKCKIDVKAYKAPKHVKHFDGVYIETQQKSGNPGWYNDPDKETTHYLFCVDCDKDMPSFYMYYIIKVEDLRKAVEEAERHCQLKSVEYSTTYGYILPYKYLKKYSVKIGRGDKYYEENNKKRATRK